MGVRSPEFTALTLLCFTLTGSDPLRAEESAQAPACAVAERSPDYEFLFTRWEVTATQPEGTGERGDPITLTWSLVPDGTPTPAGSGSRLHEMLDGLFTSRDWLPIVRQALASWGAVAGVAFVEVSDDGSPMTQRAGRPDRYGDIRFATQSLGSGVLAVTDVTASVFLNDDLTSWANSPKGDPAEYMVLRNTVAHEIGHALGLGHTSPPDGTKLMETGLNRQFVGPQDDDIRGAHRLYGDTRERDDTHEDASVPVRVGEAPMTLELSLDERKDEDWVAYEHSPVNGPMAMITLGRIGGTYTLTNRTVSAVESYEGRMYVADLGNGSGGRPGSLGIWDTTDPHRPIEIGTLELVDPAYSPADVTVVGSTVYLGTLSTNATAILVVTALDPEQPSLVAALPAPPGGVRYTNLLASAAHQRLFAIRQGLPNRLVMFDISSPLEPELLMEIDLSSVGFEASSDELVVADDVLFVGTRQSLRSFSLSAPDTLVALDELDFPAIDIAVVGDRAYLADPGGEIGIVDVSDPSSLVLTGKHPSAAAPSALATDGVYVHAGFRSGSVQTFALGAGGELELRSTLAVTSTPVDDLDVTGSVLHVVTSGDAFLVDISEPAAPTLLGDTRSIDSQRVQNLSVEILDAAGVRILASQALESNEQEVTLESPVPTGGFSTRVHSGGGDDDVQRYRLVVTLEETDVPPVTVPALLVPNPLPAGRVAITSSLAGAGVRLDVFDVGGRLLRSLTPAGGGFSWNGRDEGRRTVAPGVYLFRLRDAGGTRVIARSVKAP